MDGSRSRRFYRYLMRYREASFEMYEYRNKKGNCDSLYAFLGAEKKGKKHDAVYCTSSFMKSFSHTFVVPVQAWGCFATVCLSW